MAGLFNFSALVGNAAAETAHYDPQRFATPAAPQDVDMGDGDQPVSNHWSVGADGALESHWEASPH